jgi:hypothetical protein
MLINWLRSEPARGMQKVKAESARKMPPSSPFIIGVDKRKHKQKSRLERCAMRSTGTSIDRLVGDAVNGFFGLILAFAR